MCICVCGLLINICFGYGPESIPNYFVHVICIYLSFIIDPLMCACMCAILLLTQCAAEFSRKVHAARHHPQRACVAQMLRHKRHYHRQAVGRVLIACACERRLVFSIVVRFQQLKKFYCAQHQHDTTSTSKSIIIIISTLTLQLAYDFGDHKALLKIDEAALEFVLVAVLHKH